MTITRTKSGEKRRIQNDINNLNAFSYLIGEAEEDYKHGTMKSLVDTIDASSSGNRDDVNNNNDAGGENREDAPEVNLEYSLDNAFDNAP